MGCDIHICTEKLLSWRDVPPFWANCDRWVISPLHQTGNSYDQRYENKYILDGIYDGRNYTLFSVLANVRNYSGNPYIAEPRGLPENVSAVTYKEFEQWGDDAHSASFFTLAELCQYRDSHTTVKHSGYVSPKDAAALLKGIPPLMWCQGTSESSWVYREWEAEEDHLAPLIEALEERMVKEFWLFSNKKYAEFLHKIRIVFWFDN